MVDTVESLVQWATENQQLKGTPEFEAKTQQYLDLTGQSKPAATAPAEPAAAAPAAEPYAYSDLGVPIGSSPEAAPDTDPYSTSNAMKRVGAGAVGLLDLPAAGHNALLRVGTGLVNKATGSDYTAPQLPYIAPYLNKVMGGQELPEDASAARTLTEGGLSALLSGGGAGAARTLFARGGPALLERLLPAAASLVKNVAAPVVGSQVGGAAGGALGELAGDRETGSLLGSLAGGGALPAARTATQNYFANRGSPNAPAVAAAAERQGVTPTAGMLGDQRVQAAERQLSGLPGSSGYTNEVRQTARDQIAGALDRAAEQRGVANDPTAPPVANPSAPVPPRGAPLTPNVAQPLPSQTTPAPQPGTIGERIAEVARTSAEDLRTRSEEGQVRLQDRIGVNTPVPIQPIRERGNAMIASPEAGLGAQGERSIDQRLMDLNRSRNVEPSGQPLITEGSETVPYGKLRGWRTELGKSIEPPGGGRLPPAGGLYPVATDAMRNAAEQAGVPPRDFENAQARTRAVERKTPEVPGGPAGDYRELMKIGKKEAPAAYSHMFSDNNLQNPDRVGRLEATGHPAVGGIMGDYLRQLGRETVGAGGARGPANLATTIESMHPETRATIAGPQLQDVQDVATLARAHDYPTSQTGLNRSVGALLSSNVGRTIGGALGSMVGYGASHLVGIHPAISGVIGGAIGSNAATAINAGRARLLQSGYARNLMAGRPPNAPVTIADLIAAMNAAQQAHQQSSRSGG